jgi:hypothetical protein
MCFLAIGSKVPFGEHTATKSALFCKIIVCPFLILDLTLIWSPLWFSPTHVNVLKRRLESEESRIVKLEARFFLPWILVGQILNLSRQMTRLWISNVNFELYWLATNSRQHCNFTWNSRYFYMCSFCLIRSSLQSLQSQFW